MDLRLRDLREDHDLLQKDLAAFLHCTQQTYSRYENGNVEPSLEIIAQLALFYHTSADYLMRLTNERQPYPRM